MEYDNKILFGRIVKVHGYNGTVTVRSEKELSEDIPRLESVFIEIDGKPVPFFVSGMEISGPENVKMRFRYYESVEKISEFNGCRIFYTTAGSDKSQPDDFEGLIGCKVILKDRRLIGTITGILNNPMQDLLKITSPSDKEILVPLHEDLIISFNRVKKIVIAELPEGLTELN